MKRILYLITPLLLATLACALAPQGANPSADNRPSLSDARPALIIIAPQSGQRYALGAEIHLYAEAQDPQGGVARIEFYDNFDEIIGTVNASSPNGERNFSGEIRWRPPTTQRHFIRARAFRADDTASNLQEVSIEVVPLEGFQAPPAQTESTPESETDIEAETAPETQELLPPPPETDSETAPEVSGGLSAVVTTQVLNVRVAPRVDSVMAGPVLTAGTRIELIGRNEDGQWFAIQLPSGSIAWIYGGTNVSPTLQIEGDAGSLPFVTTQ